MDVAKSRKQLMRNHGPGRKGIPTVLTQTGIKLSKPKRSSTRDHGLDTEWQKEGCCYRQHSINIPENSACLRYRFTANKNGEWGSLEVLRSQARQEPSSLRIRRVCWPKLIAKAEHRKSIRACKCGSPGRLGSWKLNAESPSRTLALYESADCGDELGKTWTFTHNLSEFTPLRL